jgi:hypothetical protein
VSPYKEKHGAYWKHMTQDIDNMQSRSEVSEAIENARSRLNEKKFRERMQAFLATFLSAAGTTS